MKNIYIHIGVGKTGTTYIQSLLALNHKLLSSHGLYYLLSGGGEKGNGHQRFAKSFIDNKPAYMSNDSDSSRNLIINEINDCNYEHILLSSENFTLANSTEVIAFFKKNIPDCKLKVILFVRSQDELLESEYNQLVKVKPITYSIHEYLQYDFDGDFLQIANSWSECVGKNSMHCFVYKAGQNTLISDFFSCIPLPGLPNLNLQQPQRSKSNKSLGSIAVKNKLLLNKITPNLTENSNFQLPDKLIEALEPLDFPALFFNSNDANILRNTYSEINTNFSKLYLTDTVADLGGRRYTDSERDELFAKGATSIGTNSEK